MLFLVILAALVTACPNEENCVACKTKNEVTTCMYCDMGWVDGAGKCVIAPRKSRIANCVRYKDTGKDGATQCEKCEIGFYVENGQCKTCAIAGCGWCKDGGQTCNACAKGKKLQTKPELKCLETSSDIPNCYLTAYESDGPGYYCLSCNDGFSLDPNQAKDRACVKDERGGCELLAVGTEPIRCEICRSGRYIGSDGVCYRNAWSFANWVFWLLIILVIIAVVLVVWGWKTKKLRVNNAAVRAEPLIN